MELEVVARGKNCSLEVFTVKILTKIIHPVLQSFIIKKLSNSYSSLTQGQMQDYLGGVASTFQIRYCFEKKW